MDIEAQLIGNNPYVLGDTFRVKDHIKKAGGTWDGFRQAWKFDSLQAAEAAAEAAKSHLAMLVELDAFS